MATLLGVPVDVAVRQVEDMIYFETRLAEVITAIVQIMSTGISFLRGSMIHFMLLSIDHFTTR